MLRTIRAKLKDILQGTTTQVAPAPVRSAAIAKKREPAPVVVYFEKDRNQRSIERVRELLTAKQIPFQALDVSGDSATVAFIMREARCEDDDLPIVFVAGTPIGGYNELVDWDVSGKLKSAVFGDGPTAAPAPEHADSNVGARRPLQERAAPRRRRRNQGSPARASPSNE